MFARAVDNNEHVENALQNVVLFKNNCEIGEGIEIAKKYGIQKYPTYIMVNADGEVSSAWLGYDGPQKWAAVCEASKDDRRTLDQKGSAFEAEPTIELSRALAKAASAKSDFPTAVKYYRTARELDPTGASGYTREILISMSHGSRNGDFTFEEVAVEVDRMINAPDTSAGQKLGLAQMAYSVAEKLAKPDAAIPYLTIAMAATKGIEELAPGRLELSIKYALSAEKDHEKAVRLKRKSMGEDWQDSADDLNAYAWWCFKNRLDMADGKDFALRAVELATDPGRKADILDTAAAICSTMKNHQEAVDLMQRAVEFNPNRPRYQTKLEKYETLLVN